MSPGAPWCPLVSLGVQWCPLVSPGVPWCPKWGHFSHQLAKLMVREPKESWTTNLEEVISKMPVTFLQTKNTFHLVIKSGDTSNLGKTSFFFLFCFRWDPNIKWEFFYFNGGIRNIAQLCTIWKVRGQDVPGSKNQSCLFSEFLTKLTRLLSKALQVSL